MKVRSALKLICPHCRFIRRKGKQRVKCDFTGRHNQRKGFSTAIINDVVEIKTDYEANFKYLMSLCIH